MWVVLIIDVFLYLLVVVILRQKLLQIAQVEKLDQVTMVFDIGGIISFDTFEVLLDSLVLSVLQVRLFLHKARPSCSLCAEVHSLANFILVNNSSVDSMDWQKPGQFPLESHSTGKFLFAHPQVNDVEETRAKIDKVGVESEVVIILVLL